MSRLVARWLLLWGTCSACVPEIPEGTLACSRAPDAEDTCPSGWSCREDLRCYSAPSADADAATGDAQVASEIDGVNTDSQDAGGADAASADADADVEALTVVATCATPDGGVVCDDGRFCNGVEWCDPGSTHADARGCVADENVACASGQTCSEQRGGCSACADGARDDGDGDGHRARACGGDDCDDADPVRHPGRAEVCNGVDDDCDGAIDGAAASALCMRGAPARASSTCSAGACVTKCEDGFDHVAVSNTCVDHPDCPLPDPCGEGGQCVDGRAQYTCRCEAGFASAGGTAACVDVDECATNTDDCSRQAVCTNTPGSFTCTCRNQRGGSGHGARGCRPSAT